jgi:hypothetical protein
MTYIQIDQYSNIVRLVNSTQPNPGGNWIEITDPPADLSVLSYYYKNNQLIAYTPEEYSQRTDFKSGYVWVPELGWVDQRPPEMKYQQNNTLRLQYLANSDWTQMPDVTLANKAEWATYRQALRDMDYQEIVDGQFPILPQA